VTTYRIQEGKSMSFDNSELFPTSSTCSLILRIPTCYSEYQIFKEKVSLGIELTFGCVWQQKLPFLWLWYFNFLLRLLLHLQLHKLTIWKTLIKNLLYRYLSHIVNSSLPLKVHKFQKEFFILSDILSDGTAESSFNPMGPSQSMHRSSTWK